MNRLNTTIRVCTHQNLKVRYGDQPLFIVEGVILPDACGECDLCSNEHTRQTLRNLKPVEA